MLETAPEEGKDVSVIENSGIEKSEKKDKLSGMYSWMRSFVKSTSEPENNGLSNKEAEAPV